MKTNEAPEKIYLCPSELAGIDYNEEWYEYPWGDNNIEYIRKDTFIDNVCEQLKRCMYDNLMFQGRLHREEVINNFIENFKKYMEE